MKHRTLAAGAAFAMAVFAAYGALAAVPAEAATVKVAVIDPVSGPFGAIGENAIRSFRLGEEHYQRRNGKQDNSLEFIPFDNKGNVQESVLQLRKAIGEGYRYIYMSASGSAVAAALVNAITTHNERNPGDEVVLLSGAGDPSLTNEKCSFWFFAMDANTDMKSEALTSALAGDANVKRVYLINQNYSAGQQVSRAVKETIRQKRSDVEIVGDDLHLIGQVKDFSPYIAKIKLAKADTVVTSSFGPDLSLLIKAAKDGGLDATFYTFYAQTMGVPTAMGKDWEGRVKLVAYFHPNLEGLPGREIVEAMRASYDDDYVQMATYSAISILHKAFKTARSTDVRKVAYAMEGLKFTSLNGDVEMRQSDHQLQQPLFVATWARTNGKDVR